MTQSIFSPTLPDLFAEGTVFIDGDATTPTASITVRQFVAQNPRRARVFEKYGISYCCCSSNKTFWESCAARQVDPKKVLEELAECDSQPLTASRPPCGDWSKSTPAQLRHHLASVHHDSLRSELVRLSSLIDRVSTRHGALYNELWELQSVFEEFKQEMEWHLDRAENQLFPLLECLDNNIGDKTELHVSTGKEICDMELEHAYLCNTLSCLVAHTQGISVLNTACNSFKVMLMSMEELAEEVSLYLEEELIVFSHWTES